MRATPPLADTSALSSLFASAPGAESLEGLKPSYETATPDLLDGILDAAARFAQDVLVPLNEAMDSHGVQLEKGRVRTAPGHKAAWERFVADGWPTMDQPEIYGGQELPLSVGLAVQEIFDRACPAFGMLAVCQRAASRLIAEWGDDRCRNEWLPGLTSGEIGATICVSEPGAGSDLPQMTSRARLNADGQWRISGNKCWISFGDHDCTGRIVHCVLARTDDPIAQRPEISLFLVEGGGTQGPAVEVLRVEEKVGLHGSPTCVLAFDNAQATMLGERGRGLAQMFVMIIQMRLSVGAMGLGIASAATDVALAYARDRRQGGAPGSPVPINEHADVRRMLSEMVARTELTRGLLFAVANYVDIWQNSEDVAARERAGSLAQLLLPIVKTGGADSAFLNASSAIQVLGGAGYTRDWPVEQYLRDARVLSVFEGTTGIQALDLVYRRVRGSDIGLQAFLAEARGVGDDRLQVCLDALERAAAWIVKSDTAREDIDAGSVAFLDLLTLAARGWIAVRAENAPANIHPRMRIAARFCLSEIVARSSVLEDLVQAGGNGLGEKADLECLSAF